MARGLGDRGREENGEIRQTRNDTLNKDLPKLIPEFSPKATLARMRKVTGKTSEEAARRAAKSLDR